MHRIILFWATLFIYLSAESQQKDSLNSLEKFVKNASAYNQLYPREKVYLHFDNTAYFLGETLWFKAYVVQASSLEWTDLSRTLYVELLAPEGYIVETKKLKIIDGQCHGEFDLNSTYLSGYYEVRAYTRHILNWGEEAVFSRVLPVYEGNLQQKAIRDRRRNVAPKKRSAATSPQLHFFPEGGNLIVGMLTKVAFTLTGPDGKNLDLPGRIYNSRQEEVASWTSVFQGMGSFIVCPDGEEMTAVVEYQGKKYMYPLPPGKSEGVSLQINNLLDSLLMIGIEVAGNRSENDSLGLALFCRGKVYWFNSAAWGPKRFSLPKADLHRGVNRLVVFNKAGNLMAERQFFIKPDTVASIALVQADDSLVPYGPVSLDFQLSGKQFPLQTTFSVAVNDAETTDVWKAHHQITTDLLLASDLKGYIADADYYFESDDLLHRERLDLLLLVHGWVCHDWEQMCGLSQKPLIHCVEKGIMVDGKVSLVKRRSHSPAIDTPVNFKMTVADTCIYEKKLMTDSLGRFGILLDDFYGDWSATLRAPEPSEKSNYRFSLNRWFSPQPKSYTYQEWHLSDAEMLRIDSLYLRLPADSRRHVNLESAVVKRKRRLRRNTSPVHSLVHYSLREEIDYLQDHDEVYIYGHVDLPIIVGSIMKRHLYPAGSVNFLKVNHYISDTSIPEGVIHGVLRWNISRMKEVVIRTDKAIRQKYIFKRDPKNGVVSYYFDPYRKSYRPVPYNHTYPDYVACLLPCTSSQEYSFPPSSRTRYTYIHGYTSARNFYSPDYSLLPLPDPADHRRTLYWNPNVRTDSAGRASVRFYNNATCRRLRISAAAVTSGGIPMVLEQD